MSPRRYVPDDWPCSCGHVKCSHTPGAACSRCGCRFYVPEADDRAEPAGDGEDPYEWQVFR